MSKIIHLVKGWDWNFNEGYTAYPFFFVQEINPGMPNGGRVRYIKAIQASSIYFYGSSRCPGLINK